MRKYITAIEERYYADVYKLKKGRFSKETVQLKNPTINGLEISIFAYRVKIYGALTILVDNEPLMYDNKVVTLDNNSERKIADYLVESNLKDFRKTLSDDDNNTLTCAIKSGNVKILKDEYIDDNTGICYLPEEDEKTDL